VLHRTHAISRPCESTRLPTCVWSEEASLTAALGVGLAARLVPWAARSWVRVRVRVRVRANPNLNPNPNPNPNPRSAPAAVGRTELTHSLTLTLTLTLTQAGGWSRSAPSAVGRTELSTLVRVLRSQGGANLASLSVALPAVAVPALHSTDSQGRDAQHDARTGKVTPTSPTCSLRPPPPARVLRVHTHKPIHGCGNASGLIFSAKDLL
jgi:hypothetical protein